MRKPAITDLTTEQLAQWLDEQNQPAFRVKQINDWIYKKWCSRFEDMLNLPTALRQQLALAFRPDAVEVLDSNQDDQGTVKWLVELDDGETVETVLIQTPRRTTVCVSTQVGCPVRCSFCASGAQGLVRDLSTGEIVDQVRLACRELQSRINNVVVMGMGEPLLNLENLLPALEAICHPDELGIGARHITVSTSGIIPGINKLADHGRQWHLALSLHAVTDDQRRNLIPPAYRYPLDAVLEACRGYRAKTGRIVTLEYALIDKVNDSPSDADQLAEIALSMDAKINVIPCNPVGTTHRSPGAESVDAFLDHLLQRGAKATVRRSKGAAIQAACGQLRQHHTPA